MDLASGMASDLASGLVSDMVSDRGWGRVWGKASDMALEMVLEMALVTPSDDRPHPSKLLPRNYRRWCPSCPSLHNNCRGGKQ